MTGGEMSRITHLSKVADSHGFAMLFPQGYKQSWAVPGGGSTPAHDDGIDDVAFVRAMLDSVGPAYGVDTSRVIATGISNGGFLTQALGCELADHFVGIVPVAALLQKGTAANCTASRAISVLEIQGTDDPQVPYAGYAGDNGQGILSFAETIAFWVRTDKCQGAGVTNTLPDVAHDQTSVTTTSFTGCASGTEVTGYTVHGGGHAWPNGEAVGSKAEVGVTTQQFDASELIWTFLSRHL